VKAAIQTAKQTTYPYAGPGEEMIRWKEEGEAISAFERTLVSFPVTT